MFGCLAGTGATAGSNKSGCWQEQVPPLAPQRAGGHSGVVFRPGVPAREAGHCTLGCALPCFQPVGLPAVLTLTNRPQPPLPTVQFVGYSQDSRLPAEFDVSDLLQPGGDNVLAVKASGRGAPGRLLVGVKQA